MRYGLRVEGARRCSKVYEKTRFEGFGARSQVAGCMIGAYVLSAGYYDAYYLKRAEGPPPHRRGLRQAAWETRATRCSLPRAPSAAFQPGRERSDDPVAMYLNDIFTVTVNLAGPARP